MSDKNLIQHWKQLIARRRIPLIYSNLSLHEFGFMEFCLCQIHKLMFFFYFHANFSLHNPPPSRKPMVVLFRCRRFPKYSGVRKTHRISERSAQKQQHHTISQCCNQSSLSLLAILHRLNFTDFFAYQIYNTDGAMVTHFLCNFHNVTIVYV